MNTRSYETSWQAFSIAKGSIRYPLTNDFMFHVVFEENKPGLTKLLSSLLHMLPDDINSVEIMNPIDYGSYAKDKQVILDLKLLINRDRVVDIEMQVLDDGDWTDRSVLYLCRCYDNVSKGNEYDTILPAHQISIIDFSLPETSSELYATHHLRNDKTGAVYAGNFVLSVLNLKQIENATEEDQHWFIDRWAKLFKADTWEELRMTASADIDMIGIAQTLYDKNQDENARNWAQAREMFLFDERRRKAREREASQKAKEAEEEIKRLRTLLIANGIDPDTQ